MHIIKAIQYKSKKRMGALAIMLFLVMMSLFLMFSLVFSKDVVVRRVSEKGLPHTRIFYDMSKYDQDTLVEANNSRSFFASQIAEEAIDTHPELGMRYRASEFLDFPSFDAEVYDAEDRYTLLDGKPLDTLKDYEVAIMRQDAKKYGDMAIGSEIELEPGLVVTVASVIDYPYLDMVYNPIDAFDGIELFEEVMTPKLFVSSQLYQEVVSKRAQVYGQYEFEQAMRFHSWQFERFVMQHFDALPDVNNATQIAAFKQQFVDQYPQTYVMKVYYDSFDYATEEAFIKEIAMTKRNTLSATSVRDNIPKIETMAMLTLSNPLPQMLQTTLSKFVVSGIVISSLYAFYIHLQNQLNANRRTIATFSILGVCFKNVWRAYMVFFLQFIVGALAMFGLATYILDAQTIDFKWTIPALLYTFLATAAFVGLIVCMFYVQLRRLVSRSHAQVKTGGMTLITTPPLTQSRLVLVLSMKRLTSKFKLMLGFSLSIALSFTVFLIAISSLSTISNIYHKDTLGIHFDYLVPHPTYEQFVYLEDHSKATTQVSKETDVVYIDYDLSDPMNDIRKGSVVTFYDTIEDFVEVYRGEYPPHADTFIGETADELYGVVHTLASKRMTDEQHLNPRSSGYGIKAESKFLFVKQDMLGYEEARGIFGMFPTLMDRGHISYNYRKLRRSGQSLGVVDMMNTLVIMKEGQSQADFEADMSAQGIEFMRAEDILREFETLNRSLSQQSIDVLWIVGIAMGVQAIINLSGVFVQMNQDRQTEDRLLGRLGFAKRTLDKVHQIDVFARTILAMIGTLVGVLVLLPILNESLKYTFAINFLPKQLFVPIMISLGVLIVIGFCILLMSAQYKHKEGTHA